MGPGKYRGEDRDEFDGILRRHGAGNWHWNRRRHHMDAGGQRKGEIDVYEKFGEFDSAAEINRAAAAQRAEGDDEAILMIAEENGIDKEDALDYINGDVGELASPLMAAYGKLEVERKVLEPYEIMEDWLQYIRIRCAEDPRMALAVRRKGKSLKGCIAAILEWSMKHQRPVDKEILKAVGITYRVTLGIPGMGRVKQIITEYYLREEAAGS